MIRRKKQQSIPFSQHIIIFFCSFRMPPENNPAQRHRGLKMRRRTAETQLYAESGNKNSNSKPRSNQQTQQDLLRFMDEPMSSMVGDNKGNDGNNIIMDDDVLDLVHCVVKAADGRKAENIVALQVHHVSTLASVLVILSGNSRPQNQAIAAAITKDVEEQFDGQRPGGTGVPEGSAESGWMLLDYGSVMVHIMTPKSRLFYNVEGQWKNKGGIYLDLSDILVPNKVEAEQPMDNNGFVAKEDDPFWS